MKRLQGKVAIVTGGAQGIGASYCYALAAQGAAVLVADVIDGSTVSDKISSGGAQAAAFKVDVRDEASTKAMADFCNEKFGSIDILVNNAAIYSSLVMKPFDQLDPDEWDQVMSVNLKGPFFCARAVLPYMKRQGTGKIINISSGTPFKGTPNLLHYVTSKGGVLAFTRALAREVGDFGIQVNTLAPGLVLSEGVLNNTELKDKLTGPVIASRAIKRDQTPEDLVQPLIFLSSSDSDFMTGETVVVDGGSVMH